MLTVKHSMRHYRDFYVYIMASESKVLYIGITNDLKQRAVQHKVHMNQGFTDKYFVTKLVYYEICSDPLVAIQREKQLKKWRREKKRKLIERMNPTWLDLYYIDQSEFILLKAAYCKIPPLRSG